MGLDMYLKAQKYVGGWNHCKDEEKQAYAKIVRASGLGEWRCGGSPSLTVSVKVAYWRKANAIHAWFVAHCQEGTDDCDEYHVERTQLDELKLLCLKLLQSKDPTELPPCKGFFFGSTDIDEYYWQDLQDTVNQITVILDNPALGDWSFYYQSSW